MISANTAPVHPVAKQTLTDGHVIAPTETPEGTVWLTHVAPPFEVAIISLGGGGEGTVDDGGGDGVDGGGEGVDGDGDVSV
jgi:hypothetical protein